METDTETTYAHYRALVAARHAIVALRFTTDIGIDPDTDRACNTALDSLLELIHAIEPGQRF